MKKIRFIAIALIAMMLLSLAPASMAESPKIVKVATSESIVKCDPHDQQGWPGRAAMRMVMETLVETDHEGNTTPLMAKSWEISEDNKEITFYLFDGITASNGEVVNADDVVATFKRILADGTIAFRSSYWDKLVGVEKVDDLTVKFLFSEPDCMALTYFGITPIFTDESYAQYGEKLWLDQVMLGSGPWIWDEWVDGQYVHMTKNPNYWNKANYDPKYDEFYMYFLTEESSAIAAHLAGDVDAYISVGGISPENVTLYDSYSNIDCFAKLTSLYHFIGMQCGEGKIFNDVNMRRAFSMAFDRELIGTAFIGDDIEVAKGGPAFSFTLGYNEDIDTPYYQYDPEQAKALLQESGYKGTAINFLVGTNVPFGESIALIIAEQCAEIGLNVEVEMCEIATFQDRRKAGDYDCYITTDGVLYGEGYQFYNTRLIVDPHKHNYKNDTFVEMAKRSGTLLDKDERSELYKEINQILAYDCPIISLFCEPKTYAIDKDVAGIRLYTDGDFDFNRIDQVQ